MNQIQDVEAKQIQGIVKTNKNVVILVWVKSCSSCAKFKPIFEQLPEHKDEVLFLRMNMLKTIENLRFAEDKEVEETPTTLIYVNGKHIDSIIGYHDLEETLNMIEKITEN
jgi:thioredoxin-like negative regulator of GroEL